LEKVFIFDLDGTLLDSKNGILFSLEVVLKKNAPEYLPFLNDSIIGPPINGMLENFIKDFSLISKLAQQYRVHYDSIGFLDTKLYYGVKDGLYQLQNSLLFVSTNKPEKVALKILKNLKINSLFDKIMCIDSEAFSDKVEIVESIVGGLNNTNITVIGDSQDDYNSAKKNNCKFVFCDWGYGEIDKNKKDFKTVYSASELFNYLSTR
jgi:phosphoglycolate phosphatase